MTFLECRSELDSNVGTKRWVSLMMLSWGFVMPQSFLVDVGQFFLQSCLTVRIFSIVRGPRFVGG